MKISSKPISSPSRTEKFPPPLMRFLRSNTGSRSRGRSRSSPMFVRKKNAGVETQEPSSPKVTCIGQVRVRRSKKGTKKAGRIRALQKRRCRWIWRALWCKNFSRKPKSRTFWRGWFVCFRMGCWRKVEIVGDVYRRKVEAKGDESVKRELRREEGIDVKYESREDEEEEDGDLESKVFVSVSPPKNALLLMRSRSAPYRASSLASRFWASPSASENGGEEKSEQDNIDNIEEEEEKRNPTSKKEPICRDSAAESRTDPEMGGQDGILSTM